jgi:hypothetical protein
MTSVRRMPHGELIATVDFGIFSSVADPGSGVRCFFGPRIRDPDLGAGMEKIRIRDPGYDPRSYFRELTNLNSFMRIRIRDLCDIGSVMENLDPVSGINIPDPHHWFLGIGVRICKTLLQWGGEGASSVVTEGCHTVLGNSDGVERLCCLVLAIG